MARMSDSLGPFGPGFFGRAHEENNRRYLPRNWLPGLTLHTEHS